jgi:hypothetical protein
MAGALFDGQGCLTPAAFAAIAAAPPGAAPPELAAHLAGCARCQRRLLAKAMGTTGPRGPRRERPPVWRTVVVVFAGVVLVGIAMLVVQVLTAGR